MNGRTKDRTETPRRRGSEAGFSLIELMVVIAIIAMLASVVAYNVLGSLEDAEVTVVKAEISTFKSALINYRVVFKKFPTNEEGLQALIQNEKNRKFLDTDNIPLDPWDNPYLYKIEGSRNFSVMSYGADGVPGGSGLDADISSANLSDG